MTIGREVGTGLLFGLVSLVLVVGALSLALSEGDVAPLLVATPSPMSAATLPPPSTSISMPTATSLPAATEWTATSTATFWPDFAAPLFPSPHPTAFGPPRSDSFMFSCGPLRGWVRRYMVEPGDSLLEIAVRFHTTVEALERANCLRNSLVYVGERLWVPDMPGMTEGQAVILMFDTPTESPTDSPTPTAYDPTPTASLTDTSSPTP